MITRDSNIRGHLAEVNAVLDNGGRMVALAGQDAGTAWTQLEVLMTQWRAIELLLADSPPFVYTATRTSLHQRHDRAHFVRRTCQPRTGARTRPAERVGGHRSGPVHELLNSRLGDFDQFARQITTYLEEIESNDS